MDEFGEIIENTQHNVLTVSDVTFKIKRTLEGNYGDLWIKGEVTNYKHHSSGHRYFSLKDDRAVINATLFKQNGRLVKFNIEDGLEVKVHGRISVYPPRGQYQINVDFIEPVGKGPLQLAFEQLCEKLRQEGIFDKEKKSIPSIPANVGVVTSETGAALQDILRVTKERNAGLNIYIFPASVQGDNAPREIAEAIKKANEIKNVDVLIIGRGGGSIEDLWAFNDPLVAYAVYESDIPVISAVGHEINYSISDMVADMFTSTPSSAAMFVCKSLEEFGEVLASRKNLINSRMESRIKLYKEKLSKYSPDRLTKSFQSYISNLRNQLDDYHTQINYDIERLLTKKRNTLQRASQRIEDLNPLSILGRGYSIVRKDDNIIHSAKDLNKGDLITIKMSDGEVSAEIL